MYITKTMIMMEHSLFAQHYHSKIKRVMRVKPSRQNWRGLESKGSSGGCFCDSEHIKYKNCLGSVSDWFQSAQEHTHTQCVWVTEREADNTSHFRQICVINTAGWAQSCEMNSTWSGPNVSRLPLASQISSQGAMKSGCHTVWGH